MNEDSEQEVLKKVTVQYTWIVDGEKSGFGLQVLNKSFGDRRI